MGLSCGASCLKWLLIIFNVLFWLAGAAALGLGIWLAVDEDAWDILGIMNPDGMDYTVWKVTVYTMIGVGAFIFLVGFLGFAGACCENRCMLMTYSVFALIALAGEITCAVLALVYQDEIDATLEAEMFSDLKTKYTTVDDIDNSYVISWNNFQTIMMCCGSYNYTDWKYNPNYGSNGSAPVPWTCCKMTEISDPPAKGDVVNEQECYTEGKMTDANLQPTFSYLNNIGCHEALQIWVEDKSVIIYGVMFGIMGIQILGSMFGCMLYCAIDNAKKRGRDYA